MSLIRSEVDHVPARTYHGRRGAIENAFTYSVDYVLLDPARAEGPALFSLNKRNFFSLRDRDHGGPPQDGRGLPWVREILAEHDQLEACGRVLLLAQPRILGHVFNPVSFWLCYGPDETLRAVIAEVTNTFGDRHSYLCHHEDQRPILPDDTLSAQKIFHVSPFQPIEGGYRFNFDISGDRVAIRIDYRAGTERLIATLTGPRQPLTNRAILGASLRRPFGSRRVLGLIHWQALKLWWKGAPWHIRPEPPMDEVTR